MTPSPSAVPPALTGRPGPKQSRVAFLGPPGTFTEEALLGEPELASCDLVALRSMADVLAATDAGEVDLGFVALENSIEGTVRLVLDALVFQHDLLMQREVVMAIHQHLLAPTGVALADVERVVSFPDALAQCQEFFGRELPGVEYIAANSTAEAVAQVGTAKPPGTAALGSSLAAKLYGLNVLVPDIEDHPENKTRFVVVARDTIPPRTGHDKTSVVCFQHSDRPGSLQAILGQFAARDINLTKLESRPTKHSLGDYCFIIDLEGHVEDAVVADSLHTLHAMLPGMKFLGSYPAAGEHGEAIRRDADEAWRKADEWLSSLRKQVRR